MTIHPLEQFRVDRAMKPADLARLLDVSKATVSRWESGLRKVDIPLLLRIEERTGIPREQLRPDIFKKRPAPSTGEAA